MTLFLTRSKGRQFCSSFVLVLLLLLTSGPLHADEIRVLVYNTHGLPALVAGDSPRYRFPEIGRHTRRYDLSLLQEDFAHHEHLSGALADPQLVQRGNDGRGPFGLIFQGDGLTTISRLPPTWDVSISTYSFESCSGWLASSNDCLAAKGFQLIRVTMPDGGLFHVVNTHLDAASGEKDRRARVQQLVSIRRVVEDEVGDGALILAGDLNLNAGESKDREIFDDFVKDMGLTDSGATAAPGSDWPVLDYLLYRSGKETRIDVIVAGEDQDLLWKGEPLSDHPAIFAHLVIEPSALPGTHE